MINRLVNRKKMAVTSAVPGRTQQLNFFKIQLSIPPQAAQDLMLVDFPGFGYAKFGRSSAAGIDEVVGRYLLRRGALRLICLLNDARRIPEEEELLIQKLAFEHERRLLVVVTKIDKLNRAEKERSLAAIAEAYHLEVSDLETAGRNSEAQSLWRRILSII